MLAVAPPGVAGAVPARWLWLAIGVLVALVVGLAGVVWAQRSASDVLAVPTGVPVVSEQKSTPVHMQQAQSAPVSGAYAVPASQAMSLPQQEVALGALPAQPVALPQVPPCALCGRVESVQAVQQAAPASGVGMVAGGVLGAVVGNQVGKGSGRAAATVLGAVGGGYVGHQVEQRTRTRTVYQIRVRMDDGSVRSFTRGQPVAEGTPVRLQGKGFRVDAGAAPRPTMQVAG